MNLDLSDDEAAALLRELHHIVGKDRYPFSPRIRTLTSIRDKLRPPPAREPLPSGEATPGTLLPAPATRSAGARWNQSDVAEVAIGPVSGLAAAEYAGATAYSA